MTNRSWDYYKHTHTESNRKMQLSMLTIFSAIATTIVMSGTLLATAAACNLPGNTAAAMTAAGTMVSTVISIMVAITTANKLDTYSQINNPS